MNILTELNALLTKMGIAFETGAYSAESPDEFIVIVPLSDTLTQYADDTPQNEIQQARLSLFSKGAYIKTRNHLTRTLLAADFEVTDRRYIGFETDTRYHHYAIDVSKLYEYEPPKKQKSGAKVVKPPEPQETDNL